MAGSLKSCLCGNLFERKGAVKFCSDACRTLKQRADRQAADRKHQANLRKNDPVAYNKRRRDERVNKPDQVHRRDRRYHLAKKYRLTVDSLAAMHEAQQDRCAICNEPLAARGGPGYGPHIDHDHVTGKVRGLLCRDCNLGLGHFKDNASILTSASNYLAKHKSGQE